MSTQDIPPEHPLPPRDDPEEPSESAAEASHSPSGDDPAPPQDSEPAETKDKQKEAEPPLPNEPVPSGPPLPKEPVPPVEDDGWDCQFDPTTQAWFFYNRFTGKTQWDNPRVPDATAATAAPAGESSGPRPPTNEQPAAGGYNPAIHGDYDPNAWYAKGYKDEDEDESLAAGTGDGSTDPYNAMARFNRFTGQFQSEDMGPGQHSDEAKSRRQMNAFFDVDAAANSHDGRSLKAERSNTKVSKSQLKAFKEKRRAKKEEKRRAWLRD